MTDEYPTNGKRSSICGLYAAAILYRRSGREAQKELVGTVKDIARKCVYPQPLIAETYNATVHLTNCWKENAKGQKPWDEKYLYERLGHIKQTIALHEDTYKPDPAAVIAPIKISYKSALDERGSLAFATPGRKLNKLRTSRSLLLGSEAQVCGAIVHERNHFGIRAFHYDQHHAFCDFYSDALETIDDNVDRLEAKLNDTPYEEMIDYLAACTQSDLYDGLTENEFKSTAYGIVQVMDVLSLMDRRLWLYRYSPEEALVRTSQAYAALMFDENKYHSIRVANEAIIPHSRGEHYAKYEAAKQFYEYSHIVSSDKGFFDLYCG